MNRRKQPVFLIGIVLFMTFFSYTAKAPDRVKLSDKN